MSIRADLIPALLVTLGAMCIGAVAYALGYESALRLTSDPAGESANRIAQAEWLEQSADLHLSLCPECRELLTPRP